MTTLSPSSTLPITIIGSGLAGLVTALALTTHTDSPIPVRVLARAPQGQKTSSILAQGGMAAAVGEDDTPALHAQDTLKAGAGMGNPAVVKAMTEAAPEAIRTLRAWGVLFDCDVQGRLVLGLEGAHSRRRIVHAKGDSTGAAIVRALVERVRATPAIIVHDGMIARRLLRDEHGICGIVVTRGEDDATRDVLPARHVVLATGSVGGLWQATTTYPTSCGQGLVLAHQVGAVLENLPFVQFHPTAIKVDRDPLPLASEALRGEGARLVNDLGELFMAGVAGGELAPRDVVARHIGAQILAGRQVFLDCRMIAGFATRFPTVAHLCIESGLDPQTQLLPITPAVHYHMGGIQATVEGRTNVPYLWACGEVACTGLHGANRLASNSLLEATVMGLACGKALRALPSSPPPPSETILMTMADAAGFLPTMAHQPLQELRAMMARSLGMIRRRRDVESLLENPLLQPTTFQGYAARLIAEAALACSESCGAHQWEK